MLKYILPIAGVLLVIVLVVLLGRQWFMSDGDSSQLTYKYTIINPTTNTYFSYQTNKFSFVNNGVVFFSKPDNRVVFIMGNCLIKENYPALIDEIKQTESPLSSIADE